MKSPESKLAHKWIDVIEAAHGRGVEFGAAAHNPFGLRNCIYADREAPERDSPYFNEQMRLAGEVLATDVIADLGSPLPFGDGEFDYIVTSHVLEHVWDLIGCFAEMRRILRPYGVMVHVLPHVERTIDKGRALTTWEQLWERHASPQSNPGEDRHHSVFDTQSFLALIGNFSWLKVLDFLDVDDKVGNGFLVVLQIRHTEDELRRLNADGNHYPGQSAHRQEKAESDSPAGPLEDFARPADPRGLVGKQGTFDPLGQRP